MKILGLTGGIGSGKTTVAGFFEELGVPVYIADLEAKKLMEKDVEIKNSLLDLFGSQAFSHGEPNRTFIASQVFRDKEKLEKLNRIIHPAVADHFEKWKEKQNTPYVVYEAAILFETGGYKKCDFTLLITAPLEERLKRVQQRDRSTLEEIQSRMDNQWTDEKKASLADFIIENKELSKTRISVIQLHENLLNSL